MADPCFIIGVSLLCLASLCSVMALSLDYWEAGDIDSDALGPIRIHYISMRAGLWNEHRTFHRSSVFADIPRNSSGIVEGKMYTIERNSNYSKTFFYIIFKSYQFVCRIMLKVKPLRTTFNPLLLFVLPLAILFGLNIYIKQAFKNDDSRKCTSVGIRYKCSFFAYIQQIYFANIRQLHTFDFMKHFDTVRSLK